MILWQEKTRTDSGLHVRNSSHTNIKFKKHWHHKNASKMFDYATIADATVVIYIIILNIDMNNSNYWNEDKWISGIEIVM